MSIFTYMKKYNYPISEQLESQLTEPTTSYGAISYMNPSILMTALASNVLDSKKDIEYIKKNTGSSDQQIANWLNVNVKTYRSYRDTNTTLRPDVKEQIIVLTALVKHGINVFGDAELFSKWLNTENFMLSKNKPESILNTNSGVRIVDDRLTGIEYGDNS